MPRHGRTGDPLSGGRDGRSVPVRGAVAFAAVRGMPRLRRSGPADDSLFERWTASLAAGERIRDHGVVGFRATRPLSALFPRHLPSFAASVWRDRMLVILTNSLTFW